MYALKGMIAAMPTLFCEDEKINHGAMEELTEYLVAGGLDGLLAGGSTGEYVLLSMEERVQLIQRVTEGAAGRIPVLAGTGCACLRDTLALCERAAVLGARANVVITPYYMTFTEGDVYRYFQQVASASPIPVILYHYPGAAGTRLSSQFIGELLQMDNLIGVKNTDDMDHTAKVLYEVKRRGAGTVASGFDTLMVSSLASGVDASVGVVHNLVPSLVKKLYDAVNGGELIRAREIQDKLMPLILLLEEEPYPAPLKAALDSLGIQGGKPRLPVPAATKELAEKIKRCLTLLREEMDS